MPGPRLPLASIMIALALSGMQAPAFAQTPPAVSDTAAVQVQQAAQAWVDQYVKDRQLEPIETAVTVVPPRQAPAACDSAYNVSATDTKVLTRMRFSVRCPGASRASVYMVRARINAPVTIAAIAIPANKPLTPGDLQLDYRDVAQTPDALLNPDAAVGYTLRRALKAGQVVQSRMLKGAQVVRRGQAVQILASAGPVEVTAAGTAMQDGALDDVIRVKNVNTGKVINARVTGAGTVEPMGGTK